MRSVLERKPPARRCRARRAHAKNPVPAVRRSGWRALRRQVPYKLGALLLNRFELPAGARETLFGDDMESDATIYALYADVLAGVLRGEALVRTLVGHKAEATIANAIAAFAERTASRAARRADLHPSRADEAWTRRRARCPVGYLGARQLPVVDRAPRRRQYFFEGAQRVARAMREQEVSDVALLASYIDGVRRRLFGGAEADALGASLIDDGVLPREVRLAPTEPVPPWHAPEPTEGRLPTPEAVRSSPRRGSRRVAAPHDGGRGRCQGSSEICGGSRNARSYSSTPRTSSSRMMMCSSPSILISVPAYFPKRGSDRPSSPRAAGSNRLP